MPKKRATYHCKYCGKKHYADSYIGKAHQSWKNTSPLKK